MARVQIINEISNEHRLCLQWCRYFYDDGAMEHGYRFIWRKEDNKLVAARGQTRIPKLADIQHLMEKAKTEGWGDYDGDNL